jgi:preprotein translocase subunit SecG
MLTFLLVIHTIVAAALVTVILMQRSVGGGFTSGSSTSGLISARGAGDFLTRATSILATIFVGLCIAVAGLATMSSKPHKIDTSLAHSVPPAEPGAAPAAPATPPAPNPVPLAH